MWLDSTLLAEGNLSGSAVTFSGSPLGDALGDFKVDYVVSAAASGTIETSLDWWNYLGYVVDSGSSIIAATITGSLDAVLTIQVSSATVTPTPPPTETFTDTPVLTSTQTPYPTYTSCLTLTNTVTTTPTATSVNVVTGTITYTGTGTVDYFHRLYVGLYFGDEKLGYHYTHYGSNSGPYTIGAPSSGTYYLVAYYNYQGLPNAGPFSSYFLPAPGERYTSTGPCQNPAEPTTYAVAFAPGTFSGPNITIDDTCAYTGFYGAVTYTGNKARPGACRTINVDVYTDAGYTTRQQAGVLVKENGGQYQVVTNTNTNPAGQACVPTGLSPVYVRFWYDADGNHTFNAGDPHLDYGMVSPTSDGLTLDISFGDTYIM